MGRFTRKRSSKSISAGSNQEETTPLQKLQKTESKLSESVAGPDLGIKDINKDVRSSPMGDGCIQGAKVPQPSKKRSGRKNSSVSENTKPAETEAPVPPVEGGGDNCDVPINPECEPVVGQSEKEKNLEREIENVVQSDQETTKSDKDQSSTTMNEKNRSASKESLQKDNCDKESAHQANESHKALSNKPTEEVSDNSLSTSLHEDDKVSPVRPETDSTKMEPKPCESDNSVVSIEKTEAHQKKELKETIPQKNVPEDEVSTVTEPSHYQDFHATALNDDGLVSSQDEPKLHENTQVKEQVEKHVTDQTITENTDQPITNKSSDQSLPQSQTDSKLIRSQQSIMEPTTLMQGSTEPMSNENPAVTSLSHNTQENKPNEEQSISSNTLKENSQPDTNNSNTVEQFLTDHPSFKEKTVPQSKSETAVDALVILSQGLRKTEETDPAIQVSSLSHKGLGDDGKTHPNMIGKEKEKEIFERESLEEMDTQPFLPSSDILPEQIQPAQASQDEVEIATERECSVIQGDVRDNPEEVMEDDDITDSQLCSLDMETSDTGSTVTGQPNRSAQSSNGSIPGRVASPGPVAPPSYQPADGTKVIQGLIKELSGINQTIVKTTAEIEATRKKQDAKDNRRPF